MLAQHTHQNLSQGGHRPTEPDPGREGPESDSERVFLGLAQMCMTLPSESSAASATASDIVG
jgi:hypothetical protein